VVFLLKKNVRNVDDIAVSCLDAEIGQDAVQLFLDLLVSHDPAPFVLQLVRAAAGGLRRADDSDGVAVNLRFEF
jgi:hypothetical protein